ncbi:MAG: DnaJ domain-containing protein [Desulfovibrionaceae bacterium]
MMDITQCYITLQLKENASLKEIRNAYVTLAKKTHPDSTQEDSSEKFRRVVEAYETLVKYIQDKQTISKNNPEDIMQEEIHTEYPETEKIINTCSSTKSTRKEEIIVEPKKFLPSFQLFHKLLQKWIDDEQCVYLKQELCTPNKTIRFTIRYGTNSTKKIVEFTLPEDIQYGQKIRLKGAGKKIGSLTGDLYLHICKPGVS